MSIFLIDVSKISWSSQVVTNDNFYEKKHIQNQTNESFKHLVNDKITFNPHNYKLLSYRCNHRNIIN